MHFPWKNFRGKSQVEQSVGLGPVQVEQVGSQDGRERDFVGERGVVKEEQVVSFRIVSGKQERHWLGLGPEQVLHEKWQGWHERVEEEL